MERVEVLRDGAAAQYGSDAIAGIINIALKGYGQTNQALLGWAAPPRAMAFSARPACFTARPWRAMVFSISLPSCATGAAATGPGLMQMGRPGCTLAMPIPKNGQLAWERRVAAGRHHAVQPWPSQAARHSRAGASFRAAHSDKNLPSIYPQGFLPARLRRALRTCPLPSGSKAFWPAAGPWSLAYTAGMNDYPVFCTQFAQPLFGR